MGYTRTFRTRLSTMLFTLFLVSAGACVFGDTGKDTNMETKIKMSMEENEIIFLMSDNAAAGDFLALLPATLEFEDYNRIEKVSDLPTKLSTAGTPAGYDPEIGDLCLYAPWGNLCIFYGEFGYAGGLVKLGHAVSGADSIKHLEGPVRIELVE